MELGSVESMISVRNSFGFTAFLKGKQKKEFENRKLNTSQKEVIYFNIYFNE